MKILKNAKSYTIANVTEDDLINLIRNLPTGHKLREQCYQALLDGTDEDAIQAEYGYGKIEYWANALSSKLDHPFQRFFS